MKKFFLRFISILIFSLFISRLYCADNNSRITFNTQINSSYNNQKMEYCVIDDTTHSINSKLEWRSDYFFKLGLTEEITITAFDFFCSLAFPLPFKCGKMYDSDWYTPGIKTNLSISNLFVHSGFDAELGIKYNFDIYGFTISPLISISNSFIKLQAKNTIGRCGDMRHTHLEQNYPWNSEYSKKVKKFGIDFWNNITSVFCGIEAAKNFGAVKANAGILVSPYTYILSVDHHLNKEEGHYYQLIQKAYFKVWDFYAQTGYSLNKKNMICLAADYSFCPVTNGDFYFGWFKIENILADETSSFAFSNLALRLSWTIIGGK